MIIIFIIFAGPGCYKPKANEHIILRFTKWNSRRWWRWIGSVLSFLNEYLKCIVEMLDVECFERKQWHLAVIIKYSLLSRHCQWVRQLWLHLLFPLVLVENVRKTDCEILVQNVDVENLKNLFRCSESHFVAHLNSTRIICIYTYTIYIHTIINLFGKKYKIPCLILCFCVKNVPIWL